MILMKIKTMIFPKKDNKQNGKNIEEKNENK